MDIDHKDDEQRTEVAPGIHRSRRKAVSPSTSEALYKKRTKVFPKRVKGIYRRIKWVVLFLLLGIYYFIPFIRWDRGPGEPSQAVLVDFEHARLYFFFLEIWPQEIYYLAGLLIFAAIALFLVTALFGRVWCGYTCPQTVWTDLFVAVERFFEGDRNARLRLEKSPWNAQKILKKTGKHIVWIFIAMATGGAWVLYFHDAPSLVRDLFRGQAPMSAYVFLGLMTFTTYTLAGFMREQVCVYMCPWPRIQAAMIDEEALNVTYRYDRGEPRGPHKKGATWEGRGDCIDCRQCIAVCPTGIDIRDGMQLECIGCSLCIDACNGIMEKVGRPKWLIAYDTDENIQRRLKGEKSRFNLIRPRTIIYGVLLSVIGGIMLFSLMNRSVLDLNVMRDRSPNYVPISDTGVRNGYTLKVLNKASHARSLVLETRDLGVTPELSIVGSKIHDGKMILKVPADKTKEFRLYVSVDDVTKMQNSVVYNFILTDTDTGEKTTTETMFITGKAGKK